MDLGSEYTETMQPSILGNPLLIRLVGEHDDPTTVVDPWPAARRRRRDWTTPTRERYALVGRRPGALADAAGTGLESAGGGARLPGLCAAGARAGAGPLGRRAVGRAVAAPRRDHAGRGAGWVRSGAGG